MRYAITFSPAIASTLWPIGCRWLGLDPIVGKSLPQQHVSAVDAPRLWELTSSARRFGMQAVIKYPFRLGATISIERLVDSVEQLTARLRPVVLPGLVLRCSHGRFRLESVVEPTELSGIAAAVIQTLQPLSAPLNPSEYARLKAGILTTRERENLHAWGYPYVFEQYRFQIRLTSYITESREKEVIYSALSSCFSSVCAEPLMIDAMCLFVETGPGTPLRFLHRFVFAKRFSGEEEHCHHASITAENLYSRHQCHSS